MRRSTRTRTLSAALLVGAILLAGCATDDIYDCICTRTCDGSVRAQAFETCTDATDLALALAYSTNLCESFLAQECNVYSCACSCFEDWANCY